MQRLGILPPVHCFCLPTAFQFGQQNACFMVNELPSAFSSFRKTSLWTARPPSVTMLDSWFLQSFGKKGPVLPQDGHLRGRCREGLLSLRALRHQPQVEALSSFQAHDLQINLPPLLLISQSCHKPIEYTYVTSSCPLFSFTHFSCPHCGPHLGPIHPLELIPSQLPTYPAS